MRTLIVLALLLAACAAEGSSLADWPSPNVGSSPAVTARPTPVGRCLPTETKDTSGVITRDGRTGIVGETFALGDVISGSTNVVRRGATAGDHIEVELHQIGNSAPATWVAYGVDATPQVTPWGGVVFRIGWKPIAFEDSCWRLIIDGADTGIVLAVGH